MIKMFGIVKNGLHSYNDFGLWIKSKNIGNPIKNKITDTVPYQNGSYDFSNLYGEQTYSERKLEYVFEILESSKELMNIKKIEVLNWLSQDCGKVEFFDDAIENFYFLAECIDTSIEEKGLILTITATFSAYPFKLGKCLEGDYEWDKFCFGLDYFNEKSFFIKNMSTIQIYNPSICKIAPIIVANSNFIITIYNKRYNIKQGTSQDNRFKLNIGLNELTIEGNGNIEFNFRREVI